MGTLELRMAVPKIWCFPFTTGQRGALPLPLYYWTKWCPPPPPSPLLLGQEVSPLYYWAKRCPLLTIESRGSPFHCWAKRCPPFTTGQRDSLPLLLGKEIPSLYYWAKCPPFTSKKVPPPLLLLGSNWYSPVFYSLTCFIFA